MIKLKLDNYCQKCDMFESETYTTEYYNSGNALTPMTTDFTVTCKNAKRCRAIYTMIEEQYKPRF